MNRITNTLSYKGGSKDNYIPQAVAQPAVLHCVASINSQRPTCMQRKKLHPTGSYILIKTRERIHVIISHEMQLSRKGRAWTNPFQTDILLILCSKLNKKELALK